MRITRSFLCGATTLAMLAVSGWADQPSRSRGQLEEKATHVVSGTVRGVYASEKEKGVTHYVIEIEVGELLKGSGPAVSEVLYVRCWKRNTKSMGPNVNDGQARIPAVSERVEVYLKRGVDGGYDALEFSGIRRPPTKD
jgi:hypothetical protein